MLYTIIMMCAHYQRSIKVSRPVDLLEDLLEDLGCSCSARMPEHGMAWDTPVQDLTPLCNVQETTSEAMVESTIWMSGPVQPPELSRLHCLPL